MKTRTKIIILTIVLLVVGASFVYIIANGFLEPEIMKKTRDLGINNIMNAVDSTDLTYEEKREYIKIRYEESENHIPSLNIRIKDFTRNLEYGERPTFTVIETGYANSCTYSKLEVYSLKQKIGNDHTSDDLIYEDSIVYGCPFSNSYFPILRFWDETDFEPFPVCETEGRYLVVGDSGYEGIALEEYHCNAPRTEPEPEIESKHFTIEELLIQNQLDYHPDKLIVTSGISFQGDPGCGAVVDTNSITHWFGIDSLSEPKKIRLFSENPNMCKVNTSSCFCDVHKKLTALTLGELSYFTIQDEEKFANILIDYLAEENINRTPKFQIGKLNINYTDSSAIGYCGEIWGTNTYDFFEGAFVKDIVKDYSISKEISPLCAISNDTQYFGKIFGEE